MTGNTPGPLLQHLPAIYHAWEDLRKLLAQLEGVLFGDDGSEGLEQKIAKIPSLFNPDPHPVISAKFRLPPTPREFLPWLAGWVAVGQYQGMTEEQLRKLIARIVPLYGQRGTKIYLESMLQFFIPEDANIDINDQELEGLKLGSSRVGLDSWLGSDRPFWFQVRIRSRAGTADPEERERLKEGFEATARSVIDLAKPAHTAYQLEWEFED
jgi:phage tail-like protein